MKAKYRDVVYGSLSIWKHAPNTDAEESGGFIDVAFDVMRRGRGKTAETCISERAYRL